MINKQIGSLMANIFKIFTWGVIIFVAQIAPVNANDLAITHLDATLAGDKLQLQLEMNGPAVSPRVFKTDNPARIALDFSGVKNGLPQKTYPINRVVVNSLYVAEAPSRLRVVLNLTESVSFDSKVDGKKVLLTLINSLILQQKCWRDKQG